MSQLNARTTISVQVKSVGGSPTLQTRYVTPSASTQYINPQTGYDGLSWCVVYGDSNLVSGNIKSRVSIFGVYGNLSKGITKITTSNFDFTSKTISFIFDSLPSSITSISSIEGILAAGRVEDGDFKDEMLSYFDENTHWLQLDGNGITNMPLTSVSNGKVTFTSSLTSSDFTGVRLYTDVILFYS